MQLAPALVESASQEWCNVARRDASGTLVPVQGGQIVFSQNLHVLVQLPTNFDHASLPLVVRRQSAVQSGSTQHGFVSAKHHGPKLVFTSHPNGQANASATITVELTRSAGPASSCPASRSSSNPTSHCESDAEIAMHIARSCFCRRVPERSKSARPSHDDSATTVGPAGGGAMAVQEQCVATQNVPVPSLEGLDLTILDELQQFDSSIAASAASAMSSKPAFHACTPQVPVMPLLPLTSFVPLMEANPQQSAALLAARSSGPAMTWKMCYAKVHLRAADGTDRGSHASAAEVPLASYAHIIFKIESSFRGKCNLRVTRTFQHHAPAGAPAAVTAQARIDESVLPLCVQSCNPVASKGSAQPEGANALVASGDGQGADAAHPVDGEGEESKEAALRRALLSEMRLAERLRLMSCVVARVAAVVSKTACAHAARAALQKFVRDGGTQELTPGKSSLFVWAVHDAKPGDGMQQARNYTVIRDDLYKPGLNTATSPGAFPHEVLTGLQRFSQLCFPEVDDVAAASHHDAPAGLEGVQKQQRSQVRSASYIWPHSSLDSGAARNRKAGSSGASARVSCARHLAQLLPVYTSWGRCFVGSGINCEQNQNAGSDGFSKSGANDFHADQVVSYTRWTEQYTQAIVAEFVCAPTLAAAHKALSEFHNRAKDVCCDVFAWRILDHRASGQCALSAVYHPLYTEPEGEAGIGCSVWPTLHTTVRAAFDKFVQVSKQQAVVERRELPSGYCGGTALVVYDWPMFVPRETHASKGSMRKICNVCLVNHHGVEYIVGCGVQCCEFAGRLAGVTNDGSTDDVGGISVVSRPSRCPFSGAARHGLGTSFQGARASGNAGAGVCPVHHSARGAGDTGIVVDLAGPAVAPSTCMTQMAGSASAHVGQKRKHTYI